MASIRDAIRDVGTPRLKRPNPWVLVPLAVVGLTALLAWQRARVPARTDWQAATEAIRVGLAEGDGVAWIPYWAGEGRLFFAGLPAFHLVDPAQPDFARYRRVWLLGAFGRGAADLGGAPATVVKTEQFGGVRLELLEIKGPHVTADLRAELDRVTVQRIDVQGRETACDFWDGRGWSCDLRGTPDAARRCLGEPTDRRFAQRQSNPTCGLPAWFDGPGRYSVGRGPQPVARDARVIGGAPRRCVWFNPPPGRATQRIEWPVTGQGTLVLDHGFTDHALTDHGWEGTRTQPATLTVSRGGQTLQTLEVAPVTGWRRVEIPLTGEGPIRLEVTGQSDVDAHLCIDATVREGT